MHICRHADLRGLACQRLNDKTVEDPNAKNNHKLVTRKRQPEWLPECGNTRKERYEQSLRFSAAPSSTDVHLTRVAIEI